MAKYKPYNYSQVEGARENMEALGYEDDYFEGKMLVAESNYSSPANLSQCKEEH